MNVYVREIARELATRDIEVDVFTRWREPGDPLLQELAPGARVIHIESGPIQYIPKMEVYDRIGQFTSSLLEYVKEHGLRYDLIHSHYWLSAVVARELSARWGLPTVHMSHTLGLVKLEVSDEEADPESDMRVEIERRAVRETNTLVAASDIEAEELIGLYDADPAKVAIVPCGVDTDLFRPIRQVDAREALGRDQCERLVLFVGRIEQIKGIDVLLDALGLLFKRRPDLRGELCLLVVGGAIDPGADAPETEKIEELRRLVHEHRMEDSVDFVGSVDQDRLALWYSAADLCAVPSLTESFGLVALEAMACGVPVVATRVGGLQTVVEDGGSGLLVAPGDHAALAEAIEQVLMDHRLRIHLAHGARDRAEQFTWHRVGDGIEAIYDRMLLTRATQLPA